MLGLVYLLGRVLQQVTLATPPDGHRSSDDYAGGLSGTVGAQPPPERLAPGLTA